MRRVLLAVALTAIGAAALQRPAVAQQIVLGPDGLRAVNRQANARAGDPPGVHLSDGEGPGVAWIQGTDFGEGTLDVDLLGRTLAQRSFLGLAFHRQDDTTYEAVYLRPFNFRSSDPVAHGHAIQYISVPAFDWPRLRQDFPEEFENPVDASIDPAGWVHVRLIVRGARVQIFVGAGSSPALDVRKLGTLSGGQVGLWVGNGSDGDFANLRITPIR
jgi:hypothetical protein